MKTDKTLQPLGVVSDLNNELDVLRKENETLHKMLDVASKQREKYSNTQFENKKLRAAIKQEADYCYEWAAKAEMMGDDDRAKRHRERGDRLMSNI